MDYTVEQLEAMLAAKRAEPTGEVPHAYVDHSTPGRKRVRIKADGKFKFAGQVLPLNEIAKDGLIAETSNEDGTNVWVMPADTEVYVPDDVADDMVQKGHAEVIES